MNRKKRLFKIHPAGIAAYTVCFLLMDSCDAVASVIALCLHEAAHLIIMLLSGMKIDVVELTPFGGMMDVRSFETFSVGKQIAAAAAGVAANGLAAVVSLYYAPRTAFWQAFFYTNLSLALFNALPVWPLDGARVVMALAGLAGLQSQIRKFLSLVGIAVGCTFVGIGLFGIWNGIVNPTLLIAGPYLWYAARMEKITDKIRRIGDVVLPVKEGRILPVFVWASSCDLTPEQATLILEQSNRNSMNLFLKIDPYNGQIHSYQTEKEIWNRMLEYGRN